MSEYGEKESLLKMHELEDKLRKYKKSIEKQTMAHKVEIGKMQESSAIQMTELNSKIKFLQNQLANTQE
jgi:hypothetical protein